jgi:tetratricopeptide (TPR) repeat protein
MGVRGLRCAGLRFAVGRFRSGRFWVVLLLLIGAAICLEPALLPAARTRLLRQAIGAFAEHQFADAERLSCEVLAQWPDDEEALALAGNAAAKLGRSEEALGYYLRVRPSPSAEYVAAQHGAAKRLIVLGRAQDAEECLGRALEVDPLDERSLREMAALLYKEGRSWEALPYAQSLIRSGRFGRDAMLMVGGIDFLVISDPDFVERCLKSVPNDPLVMLGTVRQSIRKNVKLSEVEPILRGIIQRNPRLIEAQVQLGERLLHAADPAAFLRWHGALPANADAHPVIWHVRGLWAKRSGQPRAAVRCFLEALRRHPNQVASNFQLAQSLLSLGLSEDAEPFVERARHLEKIQPLVDELRELNDTDMIRQVVQGNDALGRPWEAAGWCRIALLVNPDTEWAKERLRRLNRGDFASGEFTLASSQAAMALDISRFPLPVWPKTGAGSIGPKATSLVDGAVRWVDAAAETGLAFRFFNGSNRDSGPSHIIQAPGGGVGVIDYDGDGWPDLYFPQNGLWEQRGDRNPHRDALFRNLGNGRFDDVTEHAGLGDREYSGGVAVGDYNGDGFPDIYLANIGKNRLYENMGDGTFLDVTEQAGVGGPGDQWTTSCAIVDLNGDGLPEIYAVHYVSLKEVRALTCDRQGHPRSCAPTLFPAEQDRLYLNRGDGRFDDVTDTCGIRAREGKGLGIVAADFDGSGRIDVFIGNDTTPNLYFVNQTERPGAPLRFIERGLETGVALNESGLSQASMGIAAGDADGNGLIDLFITAYYQDTNTLYLQEPGRIFVDATRKARLREPSLAMLGFGSQFLDGELDGSPDLVVTNGHVERAANKEFPDLMPPQYFKNRGDGTFVELSARSLGPFFQGQYLGRGLATLDWNRDGKDDFCVSHLDAPVALLTNRTPSTGHFLAVRLVGTAGNRDAIGAYAELKAGGRAWTRSVMGGNGYMASNERKLIFGLGPAQRIDQFQIRWPSGVKQTFKNLDADQELLFVEGEPAPLPVPTGSARK